MPYSIQEDDKDNTSQPNQEQETDDGFQSGDNTSKLSEVCQQNLEKLQKQALSKQNKRKQMMGELLRSKGFIWLATSNTYIGGWQQAGNIHRVEVAGEWMEDKLTETPSSTNKFENPNFLAANQ